MRSFIWFVMGLVIATLCCAVAFFLYKAYCPDARRPYLPATQKQPVSGLESWMGSQSKLVFKGNENVFLETRDDTKLTDKQKAIVERIEKNPATEGKPVVYMLNNVYSKLEFADKVNINFTVNNNTVEVKDCKVIKPESMEEQIKEGVRITEDKEGSVTVILRIKQGNVSGLIYHGKQTYAVESLGSYKAVISQLNQNKFKKES